LAELIFHLSRSRSRNLAVEAVAFVEECPLLSIENTTPEIAMLAGHLRNKYHHRAKSGVSFLDAIHLATAIQRNADTFVTTGNDFSGIEEITVDIYR
jgi:predicted nucleic acid-binding protein